MNKSKALVKRVGVGLTKSKKQLQRVLPKGMDVEKFIQQARTDLSRNPKLQKCDMGDLLTAYMEVAEWGLYPGKVLQEAYVLPFWDSNKNKMVPTVIPDWKGLVRKALEHPHVEDIRTGVICENDEYEILGGTANKLYHKRALNDRGELVGAYAVADLASGKSTYEVLGRDEVESIRQSSKAPNSPAWTGWYNEMAKKSAVKRLVKRLPKTQNLAQILAADNQRTSTVGDDDVLDLGTVGEKTEETADVTQPGEGELDMDELEAGDASEPEDVPQAMPQKEEPEPAPQEYEEDEGPDMAALERKLQKQCQAQGTQNGQEWDRGMTGGCLGLLREGFLVDHATEDPGSLESVKYALRIFPESELTDVKGVGKSTVKRLKKYFGLLEDEEDEDSVADDNKGEHRSGHKESDGAPGAEPVPPKPGESGDKAKAESDPEKADDPDYWQHPNAPESFESGEYTFEFVEPGDRTWDGNLEVIYESQDEEIYFDHDDGSYGCGCTTFSLQGACSHVHALTEMLEKPADVPEEELPY